MKYTKDINPFKPFIPGNASSLIIGTIPPHRFCIHDDPVNLNINDVMFYYGSSRNHFWKLAGEACGISFLMENSVNAVEQRKSFLAERGFGIADIIQSCSRINNRASDADLFNITYMDISAVLFNHPIISRLVYTGGFVRTCINRAAHTRHETADSSARLFRVIINNRHYEVRLLYSPSPRALTGMGINGAGTRLEQYKSIFS